MPVVQSELKNSLRSKSSGTFNQTFHDNLSTYMSVTALNTDTEVKCQTANDGSPGSSRLSQKYHGLWLYVNLF